MQTKTILPIEPDEEIRVEIGSLNTVIIEKSMGPAAFFNLKIKPDFEAGEWVVWREDTPIDSVEIIWTEVARFPAYPADYEWDED